MKTKIHVIIAMVSCASALLYLGCTSALKTQGVIITTVDGAMTGWATYTQNNNVSDASIHAVSNAYVVYYNAQLLASNAWIIAAQNTNNTIWQTASQAAAQSSSNLINIIQGLSK